MEYYDYNSNQQKEQEYHNKKELFKLKSVVNNYHNSINISLYISNVLINFNADCYYDLSVNKACISNLRLLDNDFIKELKDNFKEEITGTKENNKSIYEYKLNYFSRLLNKEINHHIRFISYNSFEYTVDSEHLATIKVNFLVETFRKEIFADILLFLYENTEDFIIKYISDDQTSFDYNEEIEKYNIKILSEKRRMKSMLENF